jgi:hypothetical protein
MVGSFSGAGFSAKQLAGFNQVDATEGLTQQVWDLMLGWVQSFDNGRGLLVLGIGADGTHTHKADLSYAPKTGGTILNDLVLSSSGDLTQDNLDLPLLLGSEVDMSHGFKARVSLQRNVYGSSSTDSSTSQYDLTSGSALGTLSSSSSSDLSNQWSFATGLGLDLGSLRWDMSLNTAFLASQGGWVNPAYQSTLSWSY